MEYSPCINNVKGIIKEIHCKIDNYDIEILKRETDYLITIKGNIDVFYTCDEIMKSAWQDNDKLPKNIKNFLDSLRIVTKERTEEIKKKHSLIK